jgi:protein gp37
MAQGSSIEWTEATWNPVTGCTKISPGCKHCYAERMAERLQGMGQPNYKNGFDLTLQPQMLELPLRWRTPQTIFVIPRAPARSSRGPRARATPS